MIIDIERATLVASSLLAATRRWLRFSGRSLALVPQYSSGVSIVVELASSLAHFLQDSNFAM